MLVNKDLAGREVATAHGKIKFDDKGQCKDLSAEQQKGLAKLPGFSYEEDKKPEPKKEDKAKEDKKAEPKKDKKKAKKDDKK